MLFHLYSGQLNYDKIGTGTQEPDNFREVTSQDVFRDQDSNVIIILKLPARLVSYPVIQAPNYVRFINRAKHQLDAVYRLVVL